MENSMQITNMVLDFVLVIGSFWMITAVQSFGGIFGKAFNLIVWGAIVLGIAHLTETITLEVFKMEIDSVELLHRLIVLTGFILITFGFKQLAKAGK